MAKIPVSVGILTYNSAATLERALRSIEQCDDIIVCDGGSSDTTRETAIRFGARIIEQDSTFKGDGGGLADYSGVRNQCLAAAKHPYFLYIDSDEAASTQLMAEMERIAREGSEDGYRIPIRMWLGDRLIEHSSNYPGYQYRIVRTDRGIRFVKPVHERALFSRQPDPARTTLDAPWYVYLDASYTEHYMERNWKYIQLEYERHERLALGDYLFSVVPRNLRAALGVILKTIVYRVIYSPATCMPLSVEWGRVRYHLALIFALAKRVRL